MQTRVPFLSIIVATLNCATELEGCLASVASQTLGAVEVLVTDGGSRDSTAEVVERYGTVVSEFRSGPDGGIYDAWNLVLPAVRAPWIMFLGADDRLVDSTVVEQVYARLTTTPHNEGFAAFPCWVSGPQEHVLHLSRSGARAAFARGEMGFAHPSTLHHVSLFARFGLFDASFRIAGDFEFALRSQGAELVTFPNPVLTRMGGEGLSNNPRNRVLIDREVMRARRMHGLPGATWQQAQRMIRDRAKAWWAVRSSSAGA